MPDRVAQWLEELGLGQYAQAFADNAVEFDLLAELSDADLKELGVGALGHRKQILKAIGALRRDTPTPANPSPVAAQAANAASSLPGSSVADTSVWARTPGELKPVTMLFADVVGSTALTEKLDSEDAHDRLYQAAQLMCRAVERHRGTVCRFMGDGIMAMFGAPVSSERHALEACRAALDMQAEIARYGRLLQEQFGVGLQIRVGLNSGEVVVLEVGDDHDKPEYDASGPTVPLAARMEQAAEAGSILITESTRALAGDLIDTSEQSPISVKGVSAPVTMHRLLAIRSAAETRLADRRKPMFGRRSELAQFAGLLEACLESGTGQVVFVRGEAGIGKSRLAEEMALEARRRGFASHKALVLDFGAGKGQEAIPSLVRSLLGIAPGSGKREREAALERAVSGGLVERESRVYLNDLLDLEQSAELQILYNAMEQRVRKEGKRQVVLTLLSRLAARQPLLVVVEDLHWADDITLDYLARLAAAASQCPTLLVLTSRAEGEPLDATWRALAGEVPIVTWDLSPLRRDDAIKLVSGFIDVSEDLVKRCIERAAGNPLFLEQLLLSVGKGAGESVPDSIKSLVLARLDQLEYDDKHALQAASVLGQRFDPDALRYLIEQPDYTCHELIARHLLRPEDQFYLFAHALIQEGTYASLIKKQRVGLHRRAAEWYRTRDLGLHAEHLDHAGDAAAAQAYVNAAREQSRLNRPERALQLARRGLEIAGEVERFALTCLEGEQLRTIGAIDDSTEAYRRATELAADKPNQCRALLGLAEGLALKDAQADLIETLAAAETIATARSMTLELARIFQLRGGLLFFGSDIEACHEANQRALQYAREAGASELEAQALSGLGDVEFSRGHLRTSKGYFTQCIDLAHRHGFGRVLAANLPMLAELHYWGLDLTAAVSAADEGVELALKTHDLRAELLNHSIRGYIVAEAGRLDDGEFSSRRALEIARTLGSVNMLVMCLCSLSGILMLLNKRDEAQKFARESFEILRKTPEVAPFYGPNILGTLALSTDEVEHRRALMTEAETLLQGYCVSHNHSAFNEMAMQICRDQREWDEVERYAQALEDYTRAEPMPRTDFVIARGRAFARLGRGPRDQSIRDELQHLYELAESTGMKLASAELAEAIAEFDSG